MSPLYTVVRGIYRFLINGPEKKYTFQSNCRVSLPHVLMSPLYTVVRGIYRFLINGPEKNYTFQSGCRVSLPHVLKSPLYTHKFLKTLMSAIYFI